jgi:hypothetical protein
VVKSQVNHLFSFLRQRMEKTKQKTSVPPCFKGRHCFLLLLVVFLAPHYSCSVSYLDETAIGVEA